MQHAVDRRPTDATVFAAAVAHGIVHDPRQLLEDTRVHAEDVVSRGEVDIPTIGLLAYLGMNLDSLYALVARMPVEKLTESNALLSPIDGLLHLFLRANGRLRTHPQFVRLCRRLGLVDYWRASNTWPDCVEEVAGHYDIEAEASK